MDPGLLAALALAILAFGAVSRKAERSILTPPIFFVLMGCLVSQHALGWVHLDLEGAMIHGLAELTLVVVLFTDASRIDLTCLRREESLPLRLLGVGLPLSIVGGTLVGVVWLPGFGWREAFLLAAILAPTDAALGQAVVSSPLVPLRIRQTLNAESGLNDGVVLPVVLIAASLLGAGEHAGGWAHWLRFVGLQLLLAPLVGGAVGWLGGRLVERGSEAGWINAPFQRLSLLGLALLAFAGAELVGGNGFIAAFVGGLALGNFSRDACACLHAFGEAEGQLLTLMMFMVFGALLVPEALASADAATLGYALLSLSVVRMLPVALSLLGAGLKPVSVAFLGWFGPRGLASILFALLVVEAGGVPIAPRLSGIVMLTVLLSTLLHGVSAYPLARRYGEWVTRGELGALAEHAPSPEHPVRVTHSPDPAHG